MAPSSSSSSSRRQRRQSVLRRRQPKRSSAPRAGCAAGMRRARFRDHASFRAPLSSSQCRTQCREGRSARVERMSLNLLSRVRLLFRLLLLFPLLLAWWRAASDEARQVQKARKMHAGCTVYEASSIGAALARQCHPPPPPPDRTRFPLFRLNESRESLKQGEECLHGATCVARETALEIGKKVLLPTPLLPQSLAVASPRRAIGIRRRPRCRRRRLPPAPTAALIARLTRRASSLPPPPPGAMRRTSDVVRVHDFALALTLRLRSDRKKEGGAAAAAAAATKCVANLLPKEEVDGGGANYE